MRSSVIDRLLTWIFIYNCIYSSEDTDTVSYALDALCNMMNDAQTDVNPQALVNIPPDLGKQFTEIFVKDPENVQLVLSFLSVKFIKTSHNCLYAIK